MSTPEEVLKTVNRIICMFGMLAALATGVYAQGTLTANVPFSFLVNGRVMPPGSYTFKQALSDDPRVLAIHGDSESAVVVSNIASYSGDVPRLVFRRVDDQFVLVRIDDESQQYALSLTREEKSELAKGVVKSKTIALAHN
jgi:hypothetical protein